MPDPRKQRDLGKVTTPESPQHDEPKQKHRSRTEGTIRDFDASERSDNQGHGHPREERGRTTDTPS